MTTSRVALPQLMVPCPPLFPYPTNARSRPTADQFSAPRTPPAPTQLTTEWPTTAEPAPPPGPPAPLSPLLPDAPPCAGLPPAPPAPLLAEVTPLLGTPPAPALEAD